MNILEYSSRNAITPAPRARSHRSRHIAIVILTVPVTIAGLVIEAQYTPTFHGIMLFCEGVEMLGVICVIEAALGLIVRESGIRFRVCLSAVCLLPVALMPGLVRYQMEQEGNTRLLFTELVECPMPASLSELAIVPASVTPDLVYYFRISKADLDRILNRSRFRLAAPTASESSDMMYRLGALAFGPGDEIYVLHERDGEVRTLRVSALHTQGYLRLQNLIPATNGTTDFYRR